MNDYRCIKVLLEILQNSQDDYIRWEAARGLGKIAVGETGAIACLIILINESNNEQVRRAAALALSQIGFNNVGATTTLNLLLNSPDILTRCLVAENLVTNEVYRGQATCALQQLINHTIESIRCRTAACLGKAQISLEKATDVLGEIIQTTEDGNVYMMAVQALVDIDPENQDLLEILVNIMKDEEDWVAQHEALSTLSKVIAYGNPEDLVRKLRHLNSRVVLEALWLCARKIPYPKFYKAWCE